MKIKEAKLKTHGMYDELKEDQDYPLWAKIAEYMDGEIGLVAESSLDGHYVFLGLKNGEKNKELFYMREQDGMIGTYIDDRDRFEKDWDSGEYEPDGNLYLEAKYVELLEGAIE